VDVTIGVSIFLMAVGAILRYAVSDSVNGVDLPTVGLILMLAGLVGLVIGIWLTLAARRRYAAGYADPGVQPVDPAYPAAPAQAPPPPPPQPRY
jgi:hypothetical protein